MLVLAGRAQLDKAGVSWRLDEAGRDAGAVGEPDGGAAAVTSGLAQHLAQSWASRTYLRRVSRRRSSRDGPEASDELIVGVVDVEVDGDELADVAA